MLIDKTVIKKDYSLLIDDAVKHIKTIKSIIDYKLKSDGIYITKMLFTGDTIIYKLNIKVLKRYAFLGV